MMAYQKKMTQSKPNGKSEDAVAKTMNGKKDKNRTAKSVNFVNADPLALSGLASPVDLSPEVIEATNKLLRHLHGRLYRTASETVRIFCKPRRGAKKCQFTLDGRFEGIKLRLGFFDTPFPGLISKAISPWQPSDVPAPLFRELLTSAFSDHAALLAIEEYNVEEEDFLAPADWVDVEITLEIEREEKALPFIFLFQCSSDDVSVLCRHFLTVTEALTGVDSFPPALSLQLPVLAGHCTISAESLASLSAGDILFLSQDGLALKAEKLG